MNINYNLKKAINPIKKNNNIIMNLKNKKIDLLKLKFLIENKNNVIEKFKT